MLVTLASLCVLATSPTALAAPPDRQACFTAYEQAQGLMRRSRLRAAREAATSCLADSCPTALRADCSQWLKDIEGRMPSVVVACQRADGGSVDDARVLLDGQPWKEHLDGLATEADPGEHILRVERKGRLPTEVRVVVREGEKAQRLVVELPGDPPAALQPTPAPALAPAEAGMPASFYVFAGLGAVALGGFTFFAVTGQAKEHELDACSPRCSDAAVDPVRARFIAADVFLGVSVLALGAAAYVFFSHTRSSSPARSSGQAR